MADKIGIKPGQLAVGILGALILIAVLNIFAFLLVNIFSMLYPAFMTYKSIEYKKR